MTKTTLPSVRELQYMVSQLDHTKLTLVEKKRLADCIRRMDDRYDLGVELYIIEKFEQGADDGSDQPTK